MRNIIAVILAFMLGVQFLVAEVLPQGYEDNYTGPVMVDGIGYRINSTEKLAVVVDEFDPGCDCGNGEVPSWQADLSGVLEIPAQFEYEGEVYTIIGINTPWNIKITDVKLPSTIQYMNSFYGFGGSLNGGELVLPANLIAMQGFTATMFTSLSFPEKFTTFSSSFGSKNEFLREFVMPPMVTELPEPKESIENQRFLNKCPALVHLDLGNKIEVIPFESFMHLTALKTIRIPESVKVIAKAAFNYCSGVEDIYLPTHPIELGESFLQLTNLRRIHVPCAEPYDISRYSFPDTDFGECVVIVPDGCAEGYASRTGWNRFRIIEESQAGAVSPEESGVPVRWVDMEGRRVGSLAPGQPGIRIEGDRRTRVIGR